MIFSGSSHVKLGQTLAGDAGREVGDFREIIDFPSN